MFGFQSMYIRKLEYLKQESDIFWFINLKDNSSYYKEKKITRKNENGKINEKVIAQVQG